MARKIQSFKPQGTPCQALVATTLGFSIGIAGVALFAPVAKRLKEALDLSVAQQSFLIAMPSLTASLLRIPFGAAVDQNGGKTLVLFLLGMAMLGLLGLCSLLHRDEDQLGELSGIYWMLLGCGMLTGCGGAIFSVGAAQTAYWHPVARQGRVLGLYGGLGNLPPGLVALGLPFALRALGMFHTYLAWFCLLALGTGYYYFFGQNAWYFQLRQNGASREEAELEAKEKYGQEMFPKGSGAVQSLKMAALNIKTWALVTLYFLNYGGYLALTTWLATFWMEFHGLEDIVAGLLTGLYSEGYGLTRAFIGGPVSDRVGGEVVLLTTFPVVGLGALMLVGTTSMSCHIAATVVMAVSMGTCAAAIFKLVPVYVPEALGGAVGLVGGLGAFGSFALPPILALFVTVQGKAGYKNGFLVFCLLALLGWTIVLALRLSRRGDDDDDEEDSSEISSEISSDDYQESDVQDMKAGQAALPIQPRQLQQVGSGPLQPNGQVPPRAASFGGWAGPMVMVVPHPAPTPRTLVQVPRSPVSHGSPVHRYL